MKRIGSSVAASLLLPSPTIEMGPGEIRVFQYAYEWPKVQLIIYSVTQKPSLNYGKCILKIIGR